MDGPAYDLVVLGGGPGGYAAAFRAAQLGMRTAVVERDKIGGTCLHRGCIPTKGLLQSAEVMDTIREAKTFGIDAGQPTFDWKAVQESKWEPVRKLHAGLQGVAKHRKVDVIAGTGRCGERPGTIVVSGDGEREVTGRNVIVAAGSYARSLPGLEADGRLILTSDHALTAERLPSRVAVIGAGAVGMEFASVYRSFGVEVTVIEALPRVFPLEDADVSKEAAAQFSKRGMQIHAGARVEDVKTKDETVDLTFSKGGKAQTIEVDAVLVAVGRGAATAGLDLERWGIQTDREFVVTDADGRCGPENVWAVGDCVAGVPQLAHVAFGLGMAAAERAAGQPATGVDLERGVPRAVYSHPEVASVGLTEEQARERGYDVVVAKYSLAGNAKAQILRASRGLCKVVCERDGSLVGIHLVGPRVTELIAEALVAVGWEASPYDVAAFVHPHPTLSEVIGEAALAAIGRPLHG